MIINGDNMNSHRRRSVTKVNFQSDASRLSSVNNGLTCRGDLPDHEGPYYPKDSLKTMFAHFNVHLAKTNIPEEGTHVSQTTHGFVTDINLPHSLHDSANGPRVEEHKPVFRNTSQKFSNFENPKSVNGATRHRPITVEEELQYKLNKMACVCNMWMQRWQAERDEKVTLLEKIKATEEKCLQLIEDLNSSYSQQLSDEREQNVQLSNKIEELLEEKDALMQRSEFLSKHIEQLNDVIDAKTKTSETLTSENHHLRESLDKLRLTKVVVEPSSSIVDESDHFRALYEIALLKLNMYEKKQNQRNRARIAPNQLFTVASSPGKPTEMSVQLVGTLQATEPDGKSSPVLRNKRGREEGVPLRSPNFRNRRPNRRSSSESESFRHSSPEAWQLRRIALTSGSSLFHSDELDETSDALEKQTRYGSCSSLQSFSGSDVSDASSGHIHKHVKRYHSDAGDCVSDSETATDGKVCNLQDSNFAGLRSRRNGIYAIPTEVQFGKSKKNSSKELSEFLLRKLTMKKTLPHEEEKPVKKLKDKLKIKVGKNVKSTISTP